MNRASFPSHRLSVRLGLLAVVVLASVSLEAYAVTIDMVIVSNAGNAADTATGYGAVGYEFRIAKYETTVDQYVAFLNSNARSDTYGLYDGRMSSSVSRVGSAGTYVYASQAFMGDKPITYVDWYKAARFANWMNNGQTSGSTETGAYSLNGTSPASGVQRNPGAVFWIPSEDEWYKAAYFNPSSNGYWVYPTQTDAVPQKVTADASGVGSAGPSGNFANYGRSANVITNVGTNGGPSPYGAFDLGGNVEEWNDTEIVVQNGPQTFYSRGIRGSDFLNSEAYLRSTERGGYSLPANEEMNLGFRIATVPEPSTYAMALAGLACGGYSLFRRRKQG
jgi:formylglycine-generating enzyme required for sulfatase activity